MAWNPKWHDNIHEYFALISRFFLWVNGLIMLLLILWVSGKFALQLMGWLDRVLFSKPW